MSKKHFFDGNPQYKRITSTHKSFSRTVVAIVTDKVDRLQRSFKETPLLNDLINRNKIELHFHVENCCIHRDSTSQERLMWNMHVVMAQSYVDSLRDNVNRSIDQKLRNGEWISQAPLGYRHIKGEHRQGKIVLDESRVPLIRRLFETYASGEYTMADMRRKAKEWGLTNARGNQGYLSKSRIYATLINPFYYGVMRLIKTGEKFPHKYETIISKELFDACQAVRLGWNKKKFKYGGKEYMFRGLIQCAITGRTCSSDTKKRKRADGTPYEVTYLGAANPDDTSKKLWIKESDIIKQVEEVLKKLSLDADDLAEVVRYVKSSASGEREYHKRRITELHKEQTSIKTKIDKLMDFYLEDKIEEADYNDKRKKLIERRTDIKREIDSHDTADDNFNDKLKDLIEISANAHKTFQLSNVEGKRRIVNMVFSTLKLNGKNLEFSIASPFKEFADCAETGEWCGLVDEFRTNIDAKLLIFKLPKLNYLKF